MFSFSIPTLSILRYLLATRPQPFIFPGLRIFSMILLWTFAWLGVQLVCLPHFKMCPFVVRVPYFKSHQTYTVSDSKIANGPAGSSRFLESTSILTTARTLGTNTILDLVFIDWHLAHPLVRLALEELIDALLCLDEMDAWILTLLFSQHAFRLHLCALFCFRQAFGNCSFDERWYFDFS